jgi:hypothetical protein
MQSKSKTQRHAYPFMGLGRGRVPERRHQEIADRPSKC